MFIAALPNICNRAPKNGTRASGALSLHARGVRTRTADFGFRSFSALKNETLEL